MDDAIERGVSHRGIADVGMPVLHRELPGDDGRALAAPILEHFEEIVPLLGAERGEALVVELCAAPHNSTHVERLVMCRRQPVAPVFAYSVVWDST